MALGELYVMTFGEMQMLVWFAVNLDSQRMVITIFSLLGAFRLVALCA